MSKKALTAFKMFGVAGADLSLASVTSEVTNLEYKDNVGIEVSWTGTSPVGVLDIQHSNDNVVWQSYDFGTTISISGNSGSHTITINQTPFINLRAVYTKTSGTGTLFAIISGKEI